MARTSRRFVAENRSLKPKGLKRCCRCLEIRPVDKFSQRKTTRKAHLAGEVLSYCKECLCAIRKEKQGPEAHWYNTYGLAPEDVRAMKQEQDFKCAICCEAPKPSRGGYYEWYVDHDHKTNKVRGLVCQHCNTMLGFAKDNPEILEAGAKYLRNHGA